MRARFYKRRAKPRLFFFSPKTGIRFATRANTKSRKVRGITICEAIRGSKRRKRLVYVYRRRDEALARHGFKDMWQLTTPCRLRRRSRGFKAQRM